MTHRGNQWIIKDEILLGKKGENESFPPTSSSRWMSTSTPDNRKRKWGKQQKGDWEKNGPDPLATTWRQYQDKLIMIFQSSVHLPWVLMASQDKTSSFIYYLWWNYIRSNPLIPSLLFSSSFILSLLIFSERNVCRLAKQENRAEETEWTSNSVFESEGEKKESRLTPRLIRNEVDEVEYMKKIQVWKWRWFLAPVLTTQEAPNCFGKRRPKEAFLVFPRNF